MSSTTKTLGRVETFQKKDSGENSSVDSDSENEAVSFRNSASPGVGTSCEKKPSQSSGFGSQSSIYSCEDSGFQSTSLVERQNAGEIKQEDTLAQSAFEFLGLVTQARGDYNDANFNSIKESLVKIHENSSINKKCFDSVEASLSNLKSSGVSKQDRMKAVVDCLSSVSGVVGQILEKGPVGGGGVSAVEVLESVSTLMKSVEDSVASASDARNGSCTEYLDKALSMSNNALGADEVSTIVNQFRDVSNPEAVDCFACVLSLMKNGFAELESKKKECESMQEVLSSATEGLESCSKNIKALNLVELSHTNKLDAFEEMCGKLSSADLFDSSSAVVVKEYQDSLDIVFERFFSLMPETEASEEISEELRNALEEWRDDSKNAFLQNLEGLYRNADGLNQDKVRDCIRESLDSAHDSVLEKLREFKKREGLDEDFSQGIDNMQKNLRDSVRVGLKNAMEQNERLNLWVDYLCEKNKGFSDLKSILGDSVDGDSKGTAGAFFGKMTDDFKSLRDGVNQQAKALENLKKAEKDNADKIHELNIEKTNLEEKVRSMSEGKQANEEQNEKYLKLEEKISELNNEIVSGERKINVALENYRGNSGYEKNVAAENKNTGLDELLSIFDARPSVLTASNDLKAKQCQNTLDSTTKFAELKGKLGEFHHLSKENEAKFLEKTKKAYESLLTNIQKVSPPALSESLLKEYESFDNSLEQKASPSDKLFLDFDKKLLELTSDNPDSRASELLTEFFIGQSDSISEQISTALAEPSLGSEGRVEMAGSIQGRLNDTADKLEDFQKDFEVLQKTTDQLKTKVSEQEASLIMKEKELAEEKAKKLSKELDSGNDLDSKIEDLVKILTDSIFSVEGDSLKVGEKTEVAVKKLLSVSIDVLGKINNNPCIMCSTAFGKVKQTRTALVNKKIIEDKSFSADKSNSLANALQKSLNVTRRQCKGKYTSRMRAGYGTTSDKFFNAMSDDKSSKVDTLSEFQAVQSRPFTGTPDAFNSSFPQEGRARTNSLGNLEKLEKPGSVARNYFSRSDTSRQSLRKMPSWKQSLGTYKTFQGLSEGSEKNPKEYRFSGTNLDSFRFHVSQSASVSDSHSDARNDKVSSSKVGEVFLGSRSLEDSTGVPISSRRTFLTASDAGGEKKTPEIVGSHFTSEKPPVSTFDVGRGSNLRPTGDSLEGGFSAERPAPSSTNRKENYQSENDFEDEEVVSKKSLVLDSDSNSGLEKERQKTSNEGDVFEADTTLSQKDELDNTETGGGFEKISEKLPLPIEAETLFGNETLENNPSTSGIVQEFVDEEGKPTSILQESEGIFEAPNQKPQKKLGQSDWDFEHGEACDFINDFSEKDGNMEPLDKLRSMINYNGESLINVISGIEDLEKSLSGETGVKFDSRGYRSNSSLGVFVLGAFCAKRNLPHLLKPTTEHHMTNCFYFLAGEQGRSVRLKSTDMFGRLDSFLSLAHDTGMPTDIQEAAVAFYLYQRMLDTQEVDCAVLAAEHKKNFSSKIKKSRKNIEIEHSFADSNVQKSLTLKLDPSKLREIAYESPDLSDAVFRFSKKFVRDRDDMATIEDKKRVSGRLPSSKKSKKVPSKSDVITFPLKFTKSSKEVGKKFKNEIEDLLKVRKGMATAWIKKAGLQESDFSTPLCLNKKTGRDALKEIPFGCKTSNKKTFEKQKLRVGSNSDSVKDRNSFRKVAFLALDRDVKKWDGAHGTAHTDRVATMLGFKKEEIQEGRSENVASLTVFEKIASSQSEKTGAPLKEANKVSIEEYSESSEALSQFETVSVVSMSSLNLTDATDTDSVKSDTRNTFEGRASRSYDSSGGSDSSVSSRKSKKTEDRIDPFRDEVKSNMNSCKHSGQTPDVLVSYSNSVTLSVDDMGKRELINGDADSLRLELVKNKPLTLTNLSGKEAKDAFSYHSGVITTSMKSHAKKSVLVMRSLCQQEIGNFLPKFSNPKGRYFQRAKEENKRLLDTVVRTLNQKAPAFGFNTFVKSLLPGQKIATLNVMKRYIDDHAKSLNFETILKDSKINLYIPEPELSTKKSKKSDDVMVGVTNAALTAICLNDGLSDSEEYNESRENFFSSKNRDLTDGIEDLEKIYKDEISGMNYSSFTFKNECEALKDKLSDAKEELSELESSVSSVEENKQRIEYLKEFIGESDNKIYDLEEKISDSMFLVNFDTSKQEACLEFIENTTGNKEKLLNKVKSSEDDDFDNLKRNFEYCGGLLEHELGFISVKSDFIENKIKNLLSIDFEESTFDDVNSLFRVVYKGIEELSSYSENVLDQIRLAEGGDKNKIDAALITLAALTSSLEEMIYGLSSFSKNISASFQGKEIEESDPYYNFISTVDNSTRSLSDLNDNVMDCKKYFDSDSAKMFVFKEVNSKAVNSRYLNDSISALEKEIDEIQSNLDNLSEKRRLKTSSIENLQCLRMEVSNFDGENFDNIKKVINQSSKGFFDEYLSEGFLEDESLRGDIDLREYINVSSLDRDIELGLENVSEINAEIDILKSEIDVNKSQFSDFSEQREEIERLDFVVENDGQNGINGFLCPAFKNEKAQSIIEEIDGMKSVGFDLSKLQKEYEELESYVQEGWKKLEETCEKIDSLDKNKATRAQYEYLLKQLESSESYESLFSNISDNPSEYLGSSIQENSEDRVSSREEEIAYLEKEVNELLLEKGNYTSNLNKEKIDLKKLNEEKDKLMESSTEEGDTALKYLEDSIDAKNREIFSCVEICKKFDADISKNDASLTALRAYTSDVSDFCLESKRLMDLLESNLCENTEKLCKANNALKERIFQTPRLKVVVKKSSSEAKKDMTLKAIGSADLAYLSPLTTRPKGKRIDTPSGRVEFLKTTKELPLRMLNSRVKSKLKSVDSWSFHGIPGYDEISKKAKNYCEENSGESEISLNKIMKSFQDISVEHNTSTVLSKESPAKIFSCVTRLVADAVVSGISGAPPKLASNSEERTQLVTVLSDVLQKNIKIDDFVFDSNLDVFEQISQNIQDSFRDIVSQPGGWYAVCCREGAFSSNFYEVMGVFSGEPIDNVVQPCNKYKSQFYASMMDGFNEDTITSLCDHRRLLCDNNDLIKRVNVLNLQVKDLEYFAEKSQILVKALEKSDEDADGNSLDNLKKSGEDKTIAALKIKISGCKEEISFINANIDKLKSDKKELAKKIEATKEVKSLRSVAKRYVAALRGSLARDKSILSLNDKVVVKLESCVRKESNQESSFDIVFDFSSTDALFSTPFSTPFSDDDIASNHPDGLERFSSEGIPESEETIVLRPQPAPRTSRATTTQPMPRVTTPSPPKPSRAQTPPPAEELTALSGFRDFIDKQETFLSMEEESGVARELYENFARELCMGLKDEGVIFTPEDNYFIRKALISLDGIRQMLDNEKLRLIENNEGNEGEIAGQIESLENGVTYLNKKYEEEASRLEEMEKFDDLIDIRRESCAYFNDLLNDTDKMEDFKRIPSEERESMLNKAISILDSQIKSKMKELDYIQRDRESLHSIAQSANAKKTCVEFVEKHKAISNECKNERGIKRRLELLLFSEKETLSEGDSTA